jgi:hypothetical protein
MHQYRCLYLAANLIDDQKYHRSFWQACPN